MPALRSAVVAILVAAGIATLAGCSAGSSGSAQAIGELPEKDLAHWVMPLDDYVYSYSIQSDYAEDLLTRPCMARKGFDWVVPWRNLDALQSESYNHVGLRLFDEKLASRFGYHVAPNTDPSAVARMTVVAEQATLSPEEDAALTACLASVRNAALPLLPLDAQNATNYANDALDKAKSTGAVERAAVEWRRCMRPLGVDDLPRTPDGMPTAGLRVRFGLDGDGGDDRPASADELRLATADAACQESSGYRRTLYDTEWRYQVDALHDNADDLERIARILANNKKKVMDVIAKNAPPAP